MGCRIINCDQWLLQLSFFVAGTICVYASDSQELRPQAIPHEIRRDFSLSTFYTKCILVQGFPVVSSSKVEDSALCEAAWTVSKLLEKRPDILRRLAFNKIRLSVMSVDERTCDIPEHSDLTPSAYWNTRARGLGATRSRPSVSCAEENLLHHPGDPYSTESILIHEFAHAIHLMGLSDIDSTFDHRLQAAYRNAMKEGRWKKVYAAENAGEYWAEGVQSWFDANAESNFNHNDVNTRDELNQYDPELAALCRETFLDQDWRYIRADSPSRTEPFLQQVRRDELKPFRWSDEEKRGMRQR